MQAVAPDLSWLRAMVERHRERLRELNCDDLGNAFRFLLLFGDHLKFCDVLGGWLFWDACRWREDQYRIEQWATMIQDFIIEDARDVGGERRKLLLKHAAKTGSARAVRDLLFLARNQVAEPADAFDAKPHLLNFKNCTLDLNTMDTRACSRGDLLTTCVPFDYDDRFADAPRWRQFIHEITRGDDDYASYLQRCAGSAIQGRVREHKVYMAIGQGGTGKTTFSRAIQGALGLDYAMEAPPGLLLRSGRDAHPTRLMDLKGKRFVAVQEIGQGKQLDEELLKRLSGGDRIRAHRMHKDPVEFTPSHTIMVFANHLPRITETGRAMFRRLTVLPFQNVVPESGMDSTLGDVLLDEAPGILRWLVDGFRAYSRDGLGSCEAVETATGDYFRESDAFGRFLEECLTVHPAAKVRANRLRTAYNEWAGAQGLPPLDRMTIGEHMQERGFEKKRSNGILYIGIGLAAEVQDDNTRRDDEDLVF